MIDFGREARLGFMGVPYYIDKSLVFVDGLGPSCSSSLFFMMGESKSSLLEMNWFTRL